MEATGAGNRKGVERTQAHGKGRKKSAHIAVFPGNKNISRDLNG
jgi:hypothetical protein